MHDEIKEILDRLERIDHKEYSCGFEFADSGSFGEDCRCFEERKKLADYITKLQSKINKVTEYIEEHTDKLKTIRIPKIDFNYNKLLDMLKEDK